VVCARNRLHFSRRGRARPRICASDEHVRSENNAKTVNDLLDLTMHAIRGSSRRQQAQHQRLAVPVRDTVAAGIGLRTCLYVKDKRFHYKVSDWLAVASFVSSGEKSKH
jgi:hypothetical protein